MKKIALFFLLTFYALAYSQFKQILTIHRDSILSPDTPLKTNPFEGKFLLVGQFLPIKRNSDIKLAKVLTATGWGLIDEKGKFILPTQYYSISDFKNGLADIILYIPPKPGQSQGSKCHAVINAQGKMITPKCFPTNDYFISDKKDGFSRLRVKNTSQLADGFIKVRIDNLTSVYNEKGEQIIPAEYSEITFSGKYFQALKEAPQRHTVIYDQTGKKVKTVESTTIYITGDLAIIQDYRKTYVENLITGKRYFENQFDSLGPLNDEDEEYDKEIMLVGTNYVDHIYPKIKSTIYINKGLEIIQNKIYSESNLRYSEGQIIAENPENHGLAILNSKGEILHEYTREESINYMSLDSPGYQNKENLEKNILKYHPLWSKQTITQRVMYLEDIFILRINDSNDQNNSESIFIQKKNGKTMYRIKGPTYYFATFSKNKFLIGANRNEKTGAYTHIITDTKGNILKTAKKGQTYYTFMKKPFTEENSNKYPLDKDYNPIYKEKLLTSEQIRNTLNYIIISPEKTEIYNTNGKIVQTVNGSTKNQYNDYINGSIGEDYLIIGTEKSYTLLNKDTWKPAMQLKFKSTLQGYSEGGMFVHDDYDGETTSKTYIDPYMNVIKIIY
ncbi:WG repeat-containing protein [Chryseobacterium sp. BIGb0232]|uniref:WG repeat-containing protein n=1 Tax=Chryseobacterium sp. BIGb0232 TaxID=2940598 RepID=UPI000FB7E793|nr:WG repeat-containing protein [Chryseobacterium sp. BIGb0232]MCS4303838.1 Ca2+-binding RTX toxin-like protein [Chryseobacterium sp. BIGb0232]ROS11623.1 WG repeat protein [Chryseobacterium nakagawai]